MYILVLNAGSSTLKSALFSVEKEVKEPQDPIWKGLLDWGESRSTAKLKAESSCGQEIKQTVDAGDMLAAINTLFTTVWEGPVKVIDSSSQIDLIGHRVVHGGDQLCDPVQITPQVKEAIRSLFPLAPLHNPSNLAGMELMEKILPSVPQFAVFDTAFHSTMPDFIKTYPIPYAFSQKGIHKYGFHGISHQYCSERVAHLMNKDPSDLRTITCHLGNGASLAAVDRGRCRETTMGFTPLEGLMMGTRSGSIDPAVLLHLMRKNRMSVDEVDECLNRHSGLQGVCGASDMRAVSKKIDDNDRLAKLAFEMYVYRINYFIGALTASLNGIDALVFTAGVGENSAEVRQSVCDGLIYLGVNVDDQVNAACTPDQEISSKHSKVRVFVIHTREEWEIAVQGLLIEGIV